MFIWFVRFSLNHQQALAGLLADGRTIGECSRIFLVHFDKWLHKNSNIFALIILVQTAREEAANYRQQFKRPIPLKVLNDRISNFIHAYTLYSAVRPFGVSIILASNDPHNGPELYMIEPSGTSYVRIKFDFKQLFCQYRESPAHC